MVDDYIVFGDVVTFDTTFGTNEEKRPLVAFNTFVNAHVGKEPRSIFTDQDAAMANALESEWPKVSHGLYFNKCMYEYEDMEEFENKWKKMLQDNNLMENSWLARIYEKKEKWAKAYMKNSFTLGIRSTQISESLNSDLKDYLKSTLSIDDFFKHFDRVVEQKQNKELEAEFKMRENVPSLGEYGCVDSLIVKDDIQDTHIYIVSPHWNNEKEYKVFCDTNNDVMTCSCKKFESEGMLCCHILRVFS
ncbi:protein FAR1-RELATED SEQUENCE 5-like [Tripterygium wilfordii]|uniref:protein FAR1-RELATED SEQUENCE 5-like n=1 Tax=Tripterygium wilfordii TaxID=458696 RepID=UPI0018F81B78|nr:protein FAR1-RELATED SEQUENCE 5-like [Tripterygium wilfordii]